MDILERGAPSDGVKRDALERDSSMSTAHGTTNTLCVPPVGTRGNPFGRRRAEVEVRILPAHPTLTQRDLPRSAPPGAYRVRYLSSNNPRWLDFAQPFRVRSKTKASSRCVKQ